jgi:hypothetical protein
MNFTKASELVHHLENGLCTVVSANNFFAYCVHNNLVKKMLEDPELAAEIINNDYSGMDDGKDGGVKIPQDLLEPTPANVLLQDALQPGQPENRPNYANCCAFPKLPTQTDLQHEVELGMNSMKLAPYAPAEIYTNPHNKPLKLEVDGPASGPQSTAQSTRCSSICSGSDGGAPLSTARDFDSWRSSGPSTTTARRAHAPAAKALFPSAKPTPATSIAGEGGFGLPAPSINGESNMNLLQGQLWNPHHKLYNPERFYHPIIESYRCPHKACE